MVELCTTRSIGQGIHAMDPRVATSDVSSKDPSLPPLIRVGDIAAPKAPLDIASARLEEGTLTDLCLKIAYGVARFTTDWVSKRLHLAMPLATDVLDQLCREGLIEEIMKTNQARSHYRITDRGRAQAARSLEV